MPLTPPGSLEHLPPQAGPDAASKYRSAPNSGPADPPNPAAASGAGATQAEIDAPPRPLLNLGLNDGTFAPQSVVEAVAAFNHRSAFRNYSSPDHDPLRERIAQLDGVRPEQVFLHNGTGPILKLALPELVKSKIFASPLRVARHLVRKSGYPLYTPRWTYSKIPSKATQSGLSVIYLPLEAQNGFRIDLDHLRQTLRKRDGLVYIVNPNNPTGNSLLDIADLRPLLEEFPASTFWIDEAYVQYLEDEVPRASPLVAQYPNLLVSRSFSFAFGMAALRIGYLLAPAATVAKLESKVTDYRLGKVQEAAALAAVNDRDHLPELRQKTAQALDFLHRGMSRFDVIQTFPSKLNFILARFCDKRSAKPFAEALRQRGIIIKTFPAYGGFDNEAYFRVTTGLPEENQRFVDTLAEVLGS